MAERRRLRWNSVHTTILGFFMGRLSLLDLGAAPYSSLRRVLVGNGQKPFCRTSYATPARAARFPLLASTRKETSMGLFRKAGAVSVDSMRDAGACLNWRCKREAATALACTTLMGWMATRRRADWRWTLRTMQPMA